MYQLYDYWRSTASYRVRMVLNFKNIAYTTIPVNLLAAEEQNEAYLKVNPMGLVPTLLAEKFTLTQSMAICEWLEEKHPSPPLLGNDADERALVRSQCLLIACDIHPINNLRIGAYLQSNFNATEDDKAAWMKHWMHCGFTALESQVCSSYLVGDSITLADIFLVAQWYNAHRFSIDLSPFPKLTAIYDVVSNHAAIKKAYPTK